MKKPLTITIITLAVIALFYYMCGDSKSGKMPGAPDNEQSLVSDVPEEKNTNTEVTVERDSEDVTESEKKDTFKNPVDTMTFTVEGRELSYYAFKQFTYIRVNTELEGYIANFSANIDVIDIRNVNSYNHVLSILLPKEVTPGVYDERSHPFIVQYFGPEAGTMYVKNRDYNFTLTISEWDGPGGRAKGTFSGELKAVNGPQTVTLENGNFDIAIKQ